AQDLPTGAGIDTNPIGAWRAMKILFIEDDVEVAGLLAEVFRDEGHETRVAYSGEEGLAAIGRERPDVVFLDVLLPTMRGITVLRQIRRTDSELPVIILTGHAGPTDLAVARRLGVTEVIEKSEVLNHFSEALARVTGAQA